LTPVGRLFSRFFFTHGSYFYHDLDTIEKLMINLQTMLTFDTNQESPATNELAHQANVETQADEWVENWVMDHRVPPGMPEPLRQNLHARVRFAREHAARAQMLQTSPPIGAEAPIALRTLLIKSWHGGNRQRWLKGEQP
jgi:hypothetical protein